MPARSRASIIRALALVAVVWIATPALAWRLPWSLPDPSNPAVTLSDLERFVSAKYPVPEIGSAALEARIAAGDVLLFDVREMAEYEVSHIAGATHVEPGSSGAAFLSANGDKLKGKTAVFYCSVGVRSGVMAERVAAAASGVKVMNLRGGIFRWYKEGRAIVHGSRADSVHPYDASWGKLLDRPLQ